MKGVLRYSCYRKFYACKDTYNSCFKKIYYYKYRSQTNRGFYGIKQSRNKSKKMHAISSINRYFFDLISFISLTVKIYFFVARLLRETK